MLRTFSQILRIRMLRGALLLVAYSIAIFATLWFAYQLRFDFAVPDQFAAIDARQRARIADLVADVSARPPSIWPESPAETGLGVAS